MGRFTRAKMNKQMVRDDRAERAIKRMPIKTAILLTIGAAFILVAYYMHLDDLYIREVQVLPFALSALGALLVISFLVMGFRYAYHRGYKLKALLVPLCHGIALFIVFMVLTAIIEGIDAVMYIEMQMILQIILICAIPGVVGVILGWISRPLFRRRDI